MQFATGVSQNCFFTPSNISLADISVGIGPTLFNRPRQLKRDITLTATVSILRSFPYG
ncbi:hypothetical protein [Petrimonas mucosa]|uniref:hypothetical protein n=1 Tax=Petrimonas mucosa TaxID=1642646 RepID=UPI001756F8A0|nr:hypothetical protein [Petrimonas mucosa]HHT29342.1 hypothetical protein [Petrimonas mucosa]